MKLKEKRDFANLKYLVNGQDDASKFRMLKQEVKDLQSIII